MTSVCYEMKQFHCEVTIQQHISCIDIIPWKLANLVAGVPGFHSQTFDPWPNWKWSGAQEKILIWGTNPRIALSQSCFAFLSAMTFKKRMKSGVELAWSRQNHVNPASGDSLGSSFSSLRLFGGLSSSLLSIITSLLSLRLRWRLWNRRHVIKHGVQSLLSTFRSLISAGNPWLASPPGFRFCIIMCIGRPKLLLEFHLCRSDILRSACQTTRL